MKIITANINGIRSATSKGFWAWISEENPDVLCLQELKAHQHQIPNEAKPNGYHCYYHFAHKPGYSGVALYSKSQPDNVHIGLNSVDSDSNWQDMDMEGRYIQADFGNLSIISAYFPSGSSTAERQAIKMSFLEHFSPFIHRLKEEGREIILCGDINIAHQNIDLKNWKGNQKNSGFLPEERAWLDHLFTRQGFVDVFRALYPEKEQYSWWSNRGRARETNVGWRIDYHITTPKITKAFQTINMYTDTWFSDHAPVIATLDKNDVSISIHG
ncbi:MAG: exodeoxyribonuclease III [Zetaproteobacteria bacterium CG_4_9_14_3_um_filter_49_83]|nr:MAG: exodeoxyribonuclease III [Zetaproteobacteria bacterium CG1_02_49_23]PIQ30167.1 MAG: exodeoxyribonuclease III [Zetaproteobacteria bacterium CG17_big_fil_post_rev_8_21_14_2_50_50_13]PIV31250.1 MAG: exodeoxyribonuclease III [Zetaproteobacteria bacterium CG02_land_8_20_14_3_00_50_9]PIY54527.1 MAG: exodeoxyribonuclease III [Zetaproteobacteria bacterium CG_4_10_14_0_8_um_filter_49_80]PJA35167.1 MAG: exodeoxyribonuclease III [Zetaproteobacteria bacterium CG_4_9_14_3_um_filter_49_83]